MAHRSRIKQESILIWQFFNQKKQTMAKELIFVGGDVSKGYADFVFLTKDKKEVIPSFQLDDNREGHDILKHEIKKLSKKYQVIFGVENTGGYERNWVFAVKSLTGAIKSIEVYKLNPKAVKHQIMSLMRRTVDDKVSAEGISMYMINNYESLRENWAKSMAEKDSISDGKMLHKMIHSLLKQQTMKKNQFEKVLYQAFPEMLTFTKDSPIWVYRFLEKYPTADAVKRAKIKGLTAIKNVTEQKAKEFKALAKTSVGSKKGEIIELIISQQSKDILAIGGEIKSLKKKLTDSYEESENVEILKSLDGVGDWSAVSFLIELGDPDRFESGSQLVSFYGVNPTYKQSGDGLYKSKMSKQGSAAMRATLFTIANNLVLHNEYFKAIYAKHRQKGKKHRSAIGVIMNKALRVMWGMLKNKTKFNADVDKQNQRTEVEPKAPISAKSRVLQPLSVSAPISRSNRKKRKAILASQAPSKGENTRSKYSPVQT